VKAAEKRLGVDSAGDRIVIRWSADPPTELLRGWIAPLSIIAVAGICWILLARGFRRLASRKRLR